MASALGAGIGKRLSHELGRRWISREVRHTMMRTLTRVTSTLPLFLITVACLVCKSSLTL